MTDSNELLLAYAHHGSESAFRELVARYVDLVYSIALRRASGNSHLAEDITQNVFTDLARKARTLPPNVLLGGWLHRHTCFTASNLLRAETRRQNREREAAQMNSLHATSDSIWRELGPVLDEAIDQLEAAEREAIVLRYFEQRDLRSVGLALGVGEDAAQKRVSRAVEKLRALVTQRGAALSVTMLASALTSGVVLAAPTGLARKISSVALANTGVGVGIGGNLIAFLMAMKTKLAVTATVIVAAVAIPIAWKKSSAIESDNITTTAMTDSMTDRSFANTNATTETATNLLANAGDEPKPKESGLLRLKIVAADSGQPIPNVPLDYRRWDGAKFTGRKLQATRLGDCEVTFPRETTTHLELTTRVDGFADTRLRWQKDRGDEIPTEFTLRLERGVPIGGVVVDADGQPVAGAKVGFNHDDDPAVTKEPESHEFSWVETTTDENGRWRIDRIAGEMIRRIRGGARHPEYVDSAYLQLMQKPDAEETLRAEKLVFQLGRPVTVIGFVVDANGAPVADANVFVGGRGMSHKRSAKSLYDGSFTITGCRPGKELVSAEAEGFATTTIEVADLGRESLRIVLQQGKLLRLRIVNQQGQPVSQASVWLDTISTGPINRPRPIPVQADFNPRSDENGLVVWSNAPDTELQFDIAANGYMRLNEFKVRPDGNEHVVVLGPALMVSGQVSDKETGKLIPRFRIVAGWPRMNPGQSMGVNWSSFERDWLNFTGGRYRHVFGDALIRGMENPGYVLKFEAEGYAPLTSRIIKPDEGEVQLNVALTPVGNKKYTLLLPDGRPAANAEVGLISPGVRLELAPGRFNRQGFPSGGSILMADKEGRVQLFLDEAVHTVMIVHPEGFLSVKRSFLQGQDYLQLQSWGRLEGVITSGGNAVAGKEFSLQFDQISTSDLWFGYTVYHVKSDQDGKFVFPSVPPGRLKLHRIIRISNGWTDRFEQDVVINPGQTTQVTIDGVGCTVVARLQWPPGFDRSTLEHVFATVHTPMPTWLAEFAKDPARAATLAETPEVRAFWQNAKQFQMNEESEGVLSAENIPAGEYEISIFALPESGEGRTNLVLTGHARISIPADLPTGTFDVGKIELRTDARP